MGREPSSDNGVDVYRIVRPGPAQFYRLVDLVLDMALTCIDQGRKSFCKKGVFSC